MNHGLISKMVHRITDFNQEAWLKLSIEINNKLRREAKNDFAKDFFKLMINFDFARTMENVRKHRDIKLVTLDERKN